jgi:hypothetical protein
MMKVKQLMLNACILLCAFIAPVSLYSQRKKSSRYNGGTLYSEMVQHKSSAADTTISSEITGTDAEVRINLLAKRYTIVFKNEASPSNRMIFYFVRSVVAGDKQPGDKNYLVEFENQYYFLFDNLDNPLIKELTIRAEKILPDSSVRQYKIKGLQRVK